MNLTLFDGEMLCTDVRAFSGYTSVLTKEPTSNVAVRDLIKVTTPPTLTQYDQWGRRIDHLATSEGWRALKKMAAEEGLVNIFYNREKYGEWGRVYGFAKILMWIGESNLVYRRPRAIDTLPNSNLSAT